VRRLHELGGALLLLALCAGGAVAQDAQRWESITRDMLESAAQQRYVDPSNPQLEAEVRAIATELRCPVCQGLSLQDSPVELAQQIRAVIREQLQSGRSSEEIRAYFVSTYGEWILLSPDPQGFNLVVYYLPYLALLAGAGIVAVAVRRWTARPAGAEDPFPENEEEELHV
jgi:cytochrome c-type biogenesis protein CcmH/NrfF